MLPFLTEGEQAETPSTLPTDRAKLFQKHGFGCFFVLRLNNDIREDKNVGQDIFPGSFIANKSDISKIINNVINTQLIRDGNKLNIIY